MKRPLETGLKWAWYWTCYHSPVERRTKTFSITRPVGQPPSETARRRPNTLLSQVHFASQIHRMSRPPPPPHQSLFIPLEENEAEKVDKKKRSPFQVRLLPTTLDSFLRLAIKGPPYQRRGLSGPRRRAKPWMSCQICATKLCASGLCLPTHRHPGPKRRTGTCSMGKTILASHVINRLCSMATTHNT